MSFNGQADFDDTGSTNSHQRNKDTSNYELNKYMQKNIKPIHLPHMTPFKRADNNDPGQSSPRANMETSMIKNLIISYFGTVRKTMNDMVPKTVMAFLVNKSKNQAQR